MKHRKPHAAILHGMRENGSPTGAVHQALVDALTARNWPVVPFVLKDKEIRPCLGGYSSELKNAVDHLIPNILPFFANVDGETHHKPRYKRYAKLLIPGEAAVDGDAGWQRETHQGAQSCIHLGTCCLPRAGWPPRPAAPATGAIG